MSAEPDERDWIRAAMDRILEGTPERSNGALAVVTLTAEAGVPHNALTQRHTDLKAEFYWRVEAKGIDNEDEARLRATIARLKKTIAAKNKELGQLRADIPDLVRAVNQLTMGKQQLRDMRAPDSTVVPFHRPGSGPASRLTPVQEAVPCPSPWLAKTPSSSPRCLSSSATGWNQTTPPSPSPWPVSSAAKTMIPANCARTSPGSGSSSVPRTARESSPRTSRDQGYRWSVFVARFRRRIDRQLPADPRDPRRGPGLEHGGLAPAQNAGRRLKRGHQPPVDPASVRIRCSHGEHLHDARKPCLSVRKPTGTVDLLVAQVRRLSHPDLVLLERLPAERGLHAAPVLLLRSSAGKVPDAFVLLDEHPGRSRAQEPAVHLREFKLRRDWCLMPEIPHFRVGAHQLTLLAGERCRRPTARTRASSRAR